MVLYHHKTQPPPAQSMPVVTQRPGLTTEATAPRESRSEVLWTAENIARTRKTVSTGPGLQVTQQIGPIIVILGRLGRQ